MERIKLVHEWIDIPEKEDIEYWSQCFNITTRTQGTRKQLKLQPGTFDFTFPITVYWAPNNQLSNPIKDILPPGRYKVYTNEAITNYYELRFE